MLAGGKEKRVALFTRDPVAIYCCRSESETFTFIGLISLRFLPHIRATEMWIITVIPEAILQRETLTAGPDISIPSFGVENCVVLI